MFVKQMEPYIPVRNLVGCLLINPTLLMTANLVTVLWTVSSAGGFAKRTITFMDYFQTLYTYAVNHILAPTTALQKGFAISKRHHSQLK
jgi:hypothetical protein